MKGINKEGIIQLLKKDSQISYIASAMSPWHAIGVIASIKSLKLNNKRGIILIIINPTVGKAVIGEDNFNAIKDQVDIYIYDKASTRESIISLYDAFRFAFSIRNKNRDRTLHIISTQRADMQLSGFIYRNLRNSSIHTLSYDEGLGTYFSTSLKRLFESFSLITILGFYIKNICASIHSLVHNQNHIIANLFSYRKGVLQENNNIIPYYRDAIEISSSNILVDLSMFENSIVICTTAWMRHLVKNNIDTDLVLKIVEFLSSNNIKFVIKLHPRDVWGKDIYSRYSDNIFSLSNVSTESILASLSVKPKAIVGFSTTALVTANIFWNIPVINIAEMLDKEMLSSTYKDEVTDFNRIFGPYVKSYVEFNLFAKKIKNLL
ncbi:MAG: polysialyltransferase family glycosyltransferase [Rikenellaceae bacterium]